MRLFLLQSQTDQLYLHQWLEGRLLNFPLLSLLLLSQTVGLPHQWKYHHLQWEHHHLQWVSNPLQFHLTLRSGRHRTDPHLLLRFHLLLRNPL